jgi:peptidoglycan/xylan/chitin deacetylase (PgdA/CDA1 family)
MNVSNFLFHRVSNETDVMWPPMKPHHFERIIKYLERKYEIISLEGFLSNPGNYKKDRPLATILFDDGYKDNIEYAAPVLAAHQCPASFYIVTGCIDDNKPTWTFLLDNAIQNTRKAEIELDFSFVPDTFKRVNIGKGLKLASVTGLKPWMKNLSNQYRKQVLQEILYQCYDVPMPENKMMNWGDIRQLDSFGFIIGSHTDTHPLLASLSDENEIRDELVISYRKIIDQVRKQPQSISYPVGSYDQRVLKIAADCGYRFGLAVEQRLYKFPSENIFAIPRIELYQEPWWKTKLRIDGVYSTLKKVWR